MAQFQRKELDIEDIRLDPRFQIRTDEEMDEFHLRGMPENVDVRWPIKVYRVEGKGLLLVGGHYRLERVTLAKRETIWADVYDGSYHDAMRASRRENQDHGKPRTEKDVRNGAFQAFAYVRDEYADYSDTDIARDLGASNSWVSRLHKEWREQEGKNGQSDVGQNPDAAHGKRKPASPAAPPAEPTPLVLPADPNPDAAAEQGWARYEERRETAAPVPPAPRPKGKTKAERDAAEEARRREEREARAKKYLTARGLACMLIEELAAQGAIDTAFAKPPATFSEGLRAIDRWLESQSR